MRKKESSLFPGPRPGPEYLLRSVIFLRNRNVTTICPDDVPTDLLRAWITEDPDELIWKISGQRATAEEMLPYVVYSCAYGYHDLTYAMILGQEEFKTPFETIFGNFVPFQVILRTVLKLRMQKTEIPPFQIMHFHNYGKILHEVKGYARKHESKKFW